MDTKVEQKRKRLLTDSEEHVSRYKLYKSGTKWVVAGVTTVMFTVGLASYVAPATAHASNTADVADATSTTAESNGLADQTHVISAASTTTTATGDASTDAPKADTTTTTDPASTTTSENTGLTNQNDENDRPSASDKTADSSTVTDATDTPTVTTADTSTDKLTTDPDSTTDGNQVTDDSTSNSETTTDTPNTANNEDETTTVDTPTITGSMADGGVILPDGTFVSNRASVAKISAVNTDWVNINSIAAIKTTSTTSPVQIAGNADWTFTKSSTGYWVDNNHMGDPNQFSDAVASFAAKTWALTNFQIMATNTRTITNGTVSTVSLTSGSKIKLVVGQQTIAVNNAAALVGRLKTFGLALVMNPKSSTVSEAGAYSPYNTGVSLTSAGLVVSPNSTGEIAMPKTGKIAIIQDMAINSKNLAIANNNYAQMRVQLGVITPAVAQVLQPIVSARTVNAANNTTTSVSGIGTAAGDTITLSNQAGKVLGTTTVKADGTWTLAATLGASTDDIFAVEKNNLGDTPGIALAPQHALVNRTVQYVNSDGTTAPATKTVAAVNFARTAKSAGTVAAPKATYNAWASSNNTAAAVVTTPVETGYVADLASVTPKAVALPTAANATTVATKVTYTPVGKYTFSGAPTAFTPVTYINNTTNATAVNNSSITITYVPGYTPSVAGVALTPVNASDLTQGYKAPTPVKATANTAIVYTANAAKATVTFIDDNAATPAQSTIQADTLNGQTDGTMTYTTDATLAALTAKGYELVSDGYTTADTTAKVFDTTDDTNGASQAFTVHMKHKIVTFTPDQPGTDDGVTETDLNHTVTITDHFGGPVNEDVTETPVTFTRSGTRDYVLKTVTYTPWTTTMADGTAQTNVTLSADAFSQLAADKTGDTGFVPADITATIDGLGVADSSKDIQFSGDVTNIVRNVTYVDSLMHITYVDVDDNNKVLKTLTPKHGSFTTDIASVTGMVTDPISGQQIYPLELVSTSSALSSENGQLTTDTNGLPAETFTGTGGGVYTIELKHVHSTDTATTTRTINYTIDDGAVTAPASVTQTANWTRDIDVYKQVVEQAAEKDATTYTLVKGYATQTSPTIAEYVPDTATVAAETPAVTADNSLPANETVTVTYTRNVFTPAHPGAYADELTKTVTEVVKYVDGMTGQPMFDIDPTTGAPTTAIPDATPSVTFTRTRTNNADGTVTYSAYTPATQTIVAVTSPAIATKVATIKEVPALAVTSTSTPATITVKYFPATIQVSPHDPSGPKQPGELINPNDPTGPTYPAGVTTSDLNETYTETVHFINDDDGTAVGPDHTDAVHYERTATIDYANLDSAGNPTVTYSDWTLALNKDGSATSSSFASFAVPTDDNLVTVENANLQGGRYQEVSTDPTSTTMAITDTVHYTSAWQEVTPGDPIPDDTQVSDLSRTITEFVTYKDGVTGATLTSPTPITQTSTRTATYNTNTGEVIYTKWTTAKFAEIANPHTTTTADETDPNTGFTVPAGTDMYPLAKTINAVTADGASVEGQPTTTLADGTETYSLNYTVYYYPTTVTLDPNNPDSPKDPNEQYDPKNPNGPVWPASGLTYDDMHQTVNEVINYVDTDGNVVSTPVTNKVAYQRTATITFNDDGTANTPTYGAWTLTPTADGQAGNATIPAVISPVLTSKNLIADQPVVSAFDTASTMIGTADQTTTKTVTYYPNSVTVNPNDPLTPGAQITPGTNDPRLVPNNGVSANDLTKTATETLRYLDGQTNKQLQADATVATLTFQRTATITYGANYATDPTDYTITYSNWNPAVGSTNTFAEIDAGNALLPIVINGKLTTVNADYEDGVITPNSQKINALTETTPTDVSLAVYYYGDITITPDHPVIPGSPINPADPTSPLYPVEDSEVPVDPSNPDQPVKKLTATDLNQTSTRTIHYVSGLNGAPVAEDAVQTIYFERIAHLNYLDDGTPNVTYDDWQPTSTNSNVYQALTAPLVDNMTPTTHESAAVTESEPTTVDETVYYFPKTYTVTPGTPVDHDDPSTVKGPLNPGDPMINPDTPTVPDAQVPPAPTGLEATDLMRDVTETIQYVNGVTGDPVTSDSITGPVTTTLTLKRTAHVTYGSDGKATVTYDAWVPITFDAVTSPTDVTNMFPAEKEIASVTVATPDQTDYQYVVHYYPTEVTVTPGTPDTPADPNDPNSVVDGPLTPGEPLFPNNGNTDTPLVPTGVTDTDLLRTVTETVRYVDGNTGEPLTDVTPYTTDVTLSRKAHIHYDRDGNPSVTYDAWTPETFATVTSPDVKHYIAGMTVVPEFTVTDPTNLSLVVNYYPDTYTVTPGTPTTPTDDPSILNGPLNPGDPLLPNGNGPDAPTIPEGLTANDLTKTVYETIQYVNGVTGKTVAKTVTVPVTLTRNGHITYRDEAGNLLSKPTVTYDKWTPATFAAVDSPIIDGLFTTTPTVAETEIPTAIGVIRQVNYYPTDLTVTPGTPADPNDPNMVQGPIDPEMPDGDTGKNVPNKLNPQDPDSPVYPAGLQQPNLNQPATQTIRYIDIATGKELADPISNTLDFQRTATIHFDQAGTPTVQYNAWTPVTTDTFAAQTSPVIDGYVADRPTIDEMTLTNPVSMTLTVNYYHNYTVGPHEPVNPNDPIGPKDAGGTIDPKNPNSPIYPAGISTTDLNGTVTEKIRYVDTNDKPVAPSLTQTINVERTALVAYNPDGSTTVTYTPWVVAGTDTFPAVDSPIVPGMTPDQKTIPAIEDPDGAPVSLVVIYTRNAGGGTGTANVPDGNDTPAVTPETPAATPETPATTAKTPTATPKAKTPKSKTHQVKTPTPNAAPKAPAATANQTPNGGTNAPVAGPAGSPTTMPNATTPTDNNQPAATSETSAEKLPQTNDSSASATSALGILGMTLLGLFGLGKKRKRRED